MTGLEIDDTKKWRYRKLTEPETDGTKMLQTEKLRSDLYCEQKPL